MGEAKRRKAMAPVPLPIEDFVGHHRWTPETGAKLAELCGHDVRIAEVCTIGWIIAAGTVEASDHATLVSLLESVRVRTAREHWPKLIAAAVLASRDSVFFMAGAPLYDKLRSNVIALA